MSPPRSYKRIVVCCDGTWYESDKSDSLPSNVARMSRAVSKVVGGENGERITQVAYYQSGVGSGNSGPFAFFDKRWEGAFGAGLEANIAEAYNFIANNWAPGDEIFLFGFSRGAFTARSIAGLICEVGLLEATGMDLFTQMYDAYQTKEHLDLSQTKWAKTPYSMDKSKTMWQEFSSHLQTGVIITAVGVWDTVGSRGLPDQNFLEKMTSHNKKYEFHNTRLDPKILHAFHAVGLDEWRGSFAPTMWYLDKDNTTTELIQCWFPGYHGDVGGGTAGGWVDDNEIDEVTFAWMCDRVSPYLDLDNKALEKILYNRVLKEGDSASTNNEASIIKSNSLGDKFSAVFSKIQWGKGKIVDTNNIAYKETGGPMIRRPGETGTKYPDDKPVPREQLHEFIHPSVHYRMTQQPDYEPRGLKKQDGWKFDYGSDNKGRRWIKEAGGVEQFSIKEFVLAKKIVSATSGKILTPSQRMLVPQSLKKEMDKGE